MSVPDSHGNVSASVISDPNAPSAKLAPGETFLAAKLSPTGLPEYPAELVALKLPPHVVVIRITSKEDSSVGDIRASPLGGTTEDQYRRRFEEAVSDAVKSWRILPGEIRRMKDGPDLDGDGKPDYAIATERKFVNAFFDIAFRFEIVDGKPVVRSDAPHQ